MRYALPLFGLSFLSSGCALIEDAHRNSSLGLCSPFERHKEVARNRQWAEAAWCDFATKDAIGHRSTDYADGFKDGYAEYLYRGGNGEPPLTAPVRYRHVRYQTPEGYQAIEDWFAGYRHGASLARDSGARRFVVGPSGLHGGANAVGPPPDHPLLPWDGPVPLPKRESPKETQTERPLLEMPPPLELPRPLELPPPREAPTRPEPTTSELIRTRIRSANETAPKVNDGPLLGNTKISDLLPGRALPEGPRVPEPAKVKITQIRGADDSPVTEPRARFMGIGQTPEPPRARITTINVAPAKE